jgi:hypothetical protein
MAYSRENLQRIGPQNRGAPSLFTFVDTASTLAQIDGSGYFNDAADILVVGDFLFVRGSNGQGVSYVSGNTRDLTINPPTLGGFDILNVTSVGTIDSD